MNAPELISTPSELVWHVGFSGHRELANEKLIADAIAAWIAAELSRHPQLIAISSFADGADRLFIRAVLERGIPWLAIAPLPVEEFMEDFDAVSAEEARYLLGRAADVDAPVRSVARPDGYLDAGLKVVQHSDVLLAVWDGLEAKGTGGTKDVLDYAAEAGKQVQWIHSSTGERQLLVLDTAAKRPTGRDAPTHEEFLAAHANLVPADLIETFKCEDAKACTSGPSIRRRTLQLVLFEALSTFCALAALTVLQHKYEGWALLFAFLKAAFIGVAVMIGWRLRRRHVRDLWATARVKAELCRSTICCWATTHRAPEVGHLGAVTFQEYMKWLRFLRLRTPRMEVRPLEERIMLYRRFRIWDQLEGYYREQSARARKARRWLVPAHDVAAAAALVLALSSFFYSVKVAQLNGWRHVWTEWVGEPGTFLFLKIGPVALPALATWAMTWMSVAEVSRRERRYAAVVTELERLDARALRCHTEATWQDVVRETEQLLLNEVLEWHGSVSRSPTR